MKQRRRVLVPVLLAGAAAALAACAEPAPRSLMTRLVVPDTYGYSENWLSNDTYQVRYLGPEVRTTQIRPQWVERAAKQAEDTAYDLALWRAARLALQKGFPAFVVTDGQSEVRRYIVGRDYTTAFDASKLNIQPRYLAYYSATYLKPQVTLTVEMSRETGGVALDAQETVDRIERKYAGVTPGAISPATRYYFGPAPVLPFYEERRGVPPRAKAPEERPPPYRTMPYVPYGPR